MRAGAYATSDFKMTTSKNQVIIALLKVIKHIMLCYDTVLFSYTDTKENTQENP